MFSRSHCELRKISPGPGHMTCTRCQRCPNQSCNLIVAVLQLASFSWCFRRPRTSHPPPADPLRPHPTSTTTSHPHNMSDSELSSVLSSPPASDDEAKVIGPLDKFLQKPSSKKKKMAATTTAQAPPSPQVQRKRPASPPHEEVLADNPDIAVSCWRDMTRHDATDASHLHCIPC